ncbi:hypothetical protein [Kineothrix sp. MB12-C1]|uniref:hypothetical protein n=1 Tax=Kineothrix sp. MB12-C1 TaxID=3070215 RepID=UPI0027D25452|nr:hypothetical protein [Kineothrix sp. MB12-C1]WMC91318.1 hypothetical protein RBB56_10530 [Kineothrix sp. MB12-C1]
MDKKIVWHELIDRAKNFNGDYELFMEGALKEESFFIKLYELSEIKDFDLDNLQRVSYYERLKMIFSSVYNLVVTEHANYSIFDEKSMVYGDVFEACFFTELSTFLHDTNRIKGMTLKMFVYKNSNNYYNDKNSANYRPFKSSRDDMHSEWNTLRRARHRLLSERPVYDKKSEWSAMQKDSQHEWSFYYTLEMMDDDIKDTYKRIGNLYNDINKVIHSTEHSVDKSLKEAAYKRFLSKLEKIDYQKFLELQRAILEHICEDKEYYGMNIYRFEKELRLHNITNQVSLLLESKDEDEENDVLEKIIRMNNLYFPKVYQAFSDLEDLRYITFYTENFYSFKNQILISSRLIIDKFIEKGVFGEEWENLFIKTINETTEKVFYDPCKIDYSVTPKSQEMFIKAISTPVRNLLNI